MTSRPRFGWGVVVCVATAACAAADAGDRSVTRQAQAPACTQQCPDGARIATFKTTASEIAADTFGGAFLYVTDGCETYCEPLTRCLPPNVPVVSQGAFQCQLLPGYTKLPAPETVDLSFGTLWDPAAVTP